MKPINWLIVLVTTSLIMWHSVLGWKSITDDLYTSIAWAFIFDLSAVYMWYEGKKVIASILSAVIMIIAFMHLSNSVTIEIDQDKKVSEAIAHNKNKSEALQLIGKDAAKWGNHDATTSAVKQLNETSKKLDGKESKGFFETLKLWVKTVITMVSLFLIQLVQIYNIKKLVESRLETKLNQKEVVKNEVETKNTDVRNGSTDSEELLLANEIVNHIDTWKDQNGGRIVVKDATISRLLEISPSAVSKVRNTAERDYANMVDKTKLGIIALKQFEDKLVKLPLA